MVREEVEGEGARRPEAEMVVAAVVGALEMLEEGGVRVGVGLTNGVSGEAGEEMRVRLVGKVGEVFASRVADLGRLGLVRAILEA